MTMDDMKLRISALALAAVAALSLTSCSSGGAAADPSFDSGQAIADGIGCTGWTNDSDEMFVTEGGTCTLKDGSDVGVYYFADTEARDSYVDAAAAFGGLYLIGDTWVVDGDRAVLERLQAEHGGELSG